MADYEVVIEEMTYADVGISLTMVNEDVVTINDAGDHDEMACRW